MPCIKNKTELRKYIRKNRYSLMHHVVINSDGTWQLHEPGNPEEIVRLMSKAYKNRWTVSGLLQMAGNKFYGSLDQQITTALNNIESFL